MKFWLGILVGVVGLIAAYLVLSYLLGALVYLVVGGTILALVIAALALGFRRATKPQLPEVREARRLEKKADRALQEMKKNETEQLRR
jgi:predicted tellurium resistance membrane protein TerC